MSGFKVPYSLVTNKKDAYDFSRAQITEQALSEINVKADINYDDVNCRIEASGKGFSLSLSFEQDYCECDLQLGLLLKAFKKKIITQLEDRLKKTI